MTPAFDRKMLEQAFKRLGDIAAGQGKLVEISVYGGTALVLTFPGRAATRDVDAVFEAHKEFLRAAAATVADEFGLNADWINDGVKGFLSARDADPEVKAMFRTYSSDSGQTGLRVFTATPTYLFAMKALAMRISGTEISQDVADLRMLGEMLRVTRYEDAAAIISKFYPDDRISPKTRFGLMEIFGSSDEAGQ